ncbi:hypothetical protein HYDPIDRAFT_88603 [Hydnomerulius pinastri MD-312]|nr:hypothetical protein HYDPIDRAFT_88603 [Hydnomerulius pinastri MD-312]
MPPTKGSRYGGWLPQNPAIHLSFVKTHVDLANSRIASRHKRSQPVQNFADAINSNPAMKALFDKIFLEASPENSVKSFDCLCHMLDLVMYQAPRYHIAEDSEGNVIGEPIGVPIYLIFDLLSNTSAAYDLFRMTEFNRALKNLLQSWGGYLVSPTSNSTLNEGDEGWFSQVALKNLETHLGDLNFEQTYDCPKPQAENRGFTSWDHFFTRDLQPGVRPVDPVQPVHPDDPKWLINSACESTVYRISKEVKVHDQFWLKDQKYSLYDILNGDKEYAALFDGGTVYQAFLSPLDYHRWHSPVDGVIKKTVLLDGTYYAVLPDAGAPHDDPDLKPGDPHGALIRSQSFLTISSARALIFIEAKNPAIGLMCFVGVGMAEVSTCEVTVKEGTEVKKGQEIGMFHFGGSSHALIFRPQTKLTFADHVVPDTHLWINSIIAQVAKN